MNRVSRRKKVSFGWRLSALRIFMLALALLVTGRLFTLQIYQHDLYSSLAAARHDVSSILTPERGSILVVDKNSDNGEQYFPVAADKKTENLAVSPHDIKDDGRVADFLAASFNLDKVGVATVLAQKEKKYAILKKDLSEAEIEVFKKAKEDDVLPALGTWLESETKRFYPEGEFLAHGLGFMAFTGDGEDKKGIYGLEAQFEQLLAGKPGNFSAATEASGNLISGSFTKLIPAENGSNIVLTIDRAIQTEAQRVLKEYVQRFGAEGGQVVVADPKTGAILAMASEPTFNVNEFNKVEDGKIFTNPVVQARYEPGSIMKPLTMAAALDAGKVKPDDTYEDTGAVSFGSHTIRNSDLKAHGVQNMTQILEKSLNTGMVYVQKKMGREVLRNYFKKFGLNEKTNINLPGEISGDLRNLESSSDIDYATASFGQGVSVTPMAMIQAYTAVAHGGEMKRAHIISEIEHADGTREVVKPEVVRRVISAKTAASVAAMLVNVVENGHGKRAAVKGYYIAGKTGTAQVPRTDARGYDPNKTIGSFIGFGPVENPSFLMLVKINNPKGVRFAESTAAPAFGEIAKFILNYLQVPPTRPTE